MSNSSAISTSSAATVISNSSASSIVIDKTFTAHDQSVYATMSSSMVQFTESPDSSVKSKISF